MLHARQRLQVGLELCYVDDRMMIIFEYMRFWHMNYEFLSKTTCGSQIMIPYDTVWFGKLLYDLISRIKNA